MEYVNALRNSPEALRSQQLRGGGPVAEFERLLSTRCGFSHCAATCNATTALLGLAAMLRVNGKNVWFPNSHWEGSVAAFRLMGARIRRYDSNSKRNLGIRIKTPSIIIVPQLVDVSGIRSAAGSRQCLLVEDSSRIPGIKTNMDSCSGADIQVLSFGPGKPLSLGEGGAILFRSKALYKRFLAKTMHPERMAAETNCCVGLPAECLNARIHPISAILGIEMLAKLTVPPGSLGEIALPNISAARECMA